ncbi:hypothetical protein [Kitasatospora sp. DSM 101779]|uniref:hypothetical protein n=1 Tax=Kitasatospora sp. DSM 101779 TaxID=2853165 RepID=UPI0021DB0079|nr:hypothetical protein [Kitasatospora sp. DSM 101779]MCU7827298.1 hypothetical protein [Kitasatospora sp. DSM 101779]
MNIFLYRLARVFAILAALAGLMVLAPAGAANAATAVCSAPAQSGVLSTSYGSDPTGGLRLSTTATLDRSTGQLTAVTNVRSLLALRGFTASFFAVGYDACGNAVAESQPVYAGVNGTWLGNSNRNMPWQANWDSRITTNITRIEIVHQWSPAAGLDIYRRWQPVVCTAVKIVDGATGWQIPCPPVL